jgi:hypothetical protein
MSQIQDNVLLKDLLNNWSLSPIKDVYVSDTACDKPLFTHTWEGVDAHCDCRNSYYHGIRSEVFKGQCSFMQTAIGCKETSALQKISADKWKGKYLCIKQFPHSFFESKTIVGNKCPDDFVLCGKDSKNFGLCFPKSEGCPANKIKISNHKIDGYVNTIINDDWYVLTSTKYINDTLSVEFKYSEGRICINPSEENIKTDYFKTRKDKSHPCQTQIGKTNFDQRYQIVDSNSKFKYYTDNGIMPYVDQLTFVNSQELINFNSYLYQRSYIHWSPYCREDKKLSPQAVLKDLAGMTLYDHLYKYFSYYFLIIFISYIVISSLCKNYLTTNLITYMLLASIIANVILILALDREKDTINSLIYQKCGEFSTNMMFSDIGKKLADNLVESYKILLLSILLLFTITIKKIIY